MDKDWVDGTGRDGICDIKDIKDSHDGSGLNNIESFSYDFKSSFFFSEETNEDAGLVRMKQCSGNSEKRGIVMLVIERLG